MCPVVKGEIVQCSVSVGPLVLMVLVNSLEVQLY